MAEVQEIDVRIDAQGQVTIDVRGVTGPKCEAITRELERMLGGVVRERVHHDAYHRQDAEHRQSRNA